MSPKAVKSPEIVAESRYTGMQLSLYSDGILVIEVDTSKVSGKSSTGKNLTIASTQGFHNLIDDITGNIWLGKVNPNQVMSKKVESDDDYEESYDARRTARDSRRR